MKNLVYRGDPNIKLPLPVAAGTLAGQVVAIGGLVGIALTPETTAAMLSAGTAPQGLALGQASVELPGITIATRQDNMPICTLGQAIYRTGAGNLTVTASGNTLVGYALTALTAAGTGVIAHSSN